MLSETARKSASVYWNLRLCDTLMDPGTEDKMCDWDKTEDQFPVDSHAVAVHGEVKTEQEEADVSGFADTDHMLEQPCTGKGSEEMDADGDAAQLSISI